MGVYITVRIGEKVVIRTQRKSILKKQVRSSFVPDRDAACSTDNVGFEFDLGYSLN